MNKEKDIKFATNPLVNDVIYNKKKGRNWKIKLPGLRKNAARDEKGKIKARTAIYPGDWLYISIDPYNYKLIGTYISIAEIEFAHNLTNLQPIMNRYLNNRDSRTTINEKIFVRIPTGMIQELDRDTFHKLINRMALDKIIRCQTKRIIDNLDKFSPEEKEKIFLFLNDAESPNSKILSYEVDIE